MDKTEIILKNIKDLVWTNDYINYLDYRKNGERKKAFFYLATFFNMYKVSEKKDRRHFLNMVFNVSIISNQADLYLPQNLYNELLLPEISEWIEEEPLNPTPFKWSNNFEYNLRAIELDPFDQILIEKIANYVIGKISMNQHEIDSGFSYDGIPANDIKLISYVQVILENLQDKNNKKIITNCLDELKSIAIRNHNTE